jgi:hypothetical protein
MEFKSSAEPLKEEKFSTQNSINSSRCGFSAAIENNNVKEEKERRGEEKKRRREFKLSYKTMAKSN